MKNIQDLAFESFIVVHVDGHHTEYHITRKSLDKNLLKSWLKKKNFSPKGKKNTEKEFSWKYIYILLHRYHSDKRLPKAMIILIEG